MMLGSVFVNRQFGVTNKSNAELFNYYITNHYSRQVGFPNKFSSLNCNSHRNNERF